MKLIAIAATAACASANNSWNSWNHQKWSKPQKYEIVYGYDTAYVELCDSENYHTGKYQCVRAKDDDYHGLCRFSYVRDCDKDHKSAKEVRKFWKKIYYDTEFETDCEKPHLFYTDYASNQWHRGLAATKAAQDKTVEARGAGGVRSASDGWQKQQWGHDSHNWQGCPKPPQPYVEYGYDEVYVRECDDKDAHEGKYTCYKTSEDNYEGLCRFGYTKECEKEEHGAKLVRRYFKKVFYDEQFVQDCEQNYQAWYPSQCWQQWGNNQWNSWSSWQSNNWHGDSWSKNEWKGNDWQKKEEWKPSNDWQKKEEWKPSNNWQAKNDWQPNHWQPSSDTWGRKLSGNGNEWNSWNNGWSSQRWDSWGKQAWQPHQQWSQQWQSNQCNSWQPNCYVPSTPKYEYGYDLVTVTYCDEKDYHTGEYACVKGEDDKHDDMCRFHYVKPCEKEHPKAKTVKVYWKKTYFDREFEGECKQSSHYWNGWSHHENKWNNNWNTNQWQQEQKWSGNSWDRK